MIYVIVLLLYEFEFKVVFVRFINYCDCDLFFLWKCIMIFWRLLGVFGFLSRILLRVIFWCLVDEEKKYVDEFGLFGWYILSISKYYFFWFVDNCGVGFLW